MSIIMKKTIIIVFSAFLLLQCNSNEYQDLDSSDMDETMEAPSRDVGVIYDFRLGYGASVVPLLGQVINNGDKRIIVAARGWDNGLWWTHRKYDGRFDKWRRLAADIKYDPILKSNKDGRLEIFFLDKDNNLYHVYQEHNREWSHPISMNFKTFPSFKVATNEDGRLEVFALHRSTNEMWRLWQVEPNGNWSQWLEFENSPALSRFEIAKNSDQRLQIFGATRTYLWTVTQQVINGYWNNWHIFNYIKLKLGSKPAVGVEKDLDNYSLITLAICTADDRTIVYRQSRKNVDSFQTINKSDSCSDCYNELYFREPEMSQQSNMLFTVGNDLHLRYNAQNSKQGSSWSNWQTFSYGKVSSKNISHQSMFIRNTTGGYSPSIMTFAIFSDGNIRTSWQEQPLPMNWGNWTLLNHYQNINFIDVETISDQYGCTTVFGITNDRLVKVNNQNASPSPYCRNPNDWQGWTWVDDRDSSCHNECGPEGNSQCIDGNWHTCQVIKGCRRWVKNPKLGCMH